MPDLAFAVAFLLLMVGFYAYITRGPLMPEPQTEAGKRMLRWLAYHRSTGDPLPPTCPEDCPVLEAQRLLTDTDAIAATVIADIEKRAVERFMESPEFVERLQAVIDEQPGFTWHGRQYAAASIVKALTEGGH